jgi:hypothetical protein
LALIGQERKRFADELSKEYGLSFQ